ncbi:hypothetical protein E3P99_01392 [Wallemia hederae]|uniref:Bromo domain-containing protein n=1 Tax=Wallemia hederae TaxID=1540922 RepID=A0A4T0FS16_9BASI|nr:hypothetical protein E3P99_01392 [Wallemia hederae]
MSSTKYLNKELEAYELNIDYKLLLSDIKKATKSIQPTNNNHNLSNEWYELLDKVLNELKSSPNSFAFRKPVRKFEAPDYHLVITQPMDLSTVNKKIKQRQYKNKTQFKNDLELIWNNCLVYNTDPNHPLRSHAIHLQTKSTQLLDFVPDSPNSLSQDEDASLDRSATPVTQKRPHKKRRLDSNAIVRSISPTNSPTPFIPSVTLSNPFSDSLAVTRPADMVVMDSEESDEPWRLFYSETQEHNGEANEKEDEKENDNENANANEETADDAEKADNGEKDKDESAKEKPTHTQTQTQTLTMIDSEPFKQTLRNRIPRAPTVDSHTPAQQEMSIPSIATHSTLQTTFNEHLSMLRQLHKQSRVGAVEKESDDMDIDESGSEGSVDDADSSSSDGGRVSYDWGTSLLASSYGQEDGQEDGRGQLTEDAVGGILHKVVIGLLLHAGFTSSTTYATGVLDHLVHTYMTRLCVGMKEATEYVNDKEADAYRVVEHVLNQNATSVDSLSEYITTDLADPGTRRIRHTLAAAQEDAEVPLLDLDKVAALVDHGGEQVDEKERVGEDHKLAENKDDADENANEIANEKEELVREEKEDASASASVEQSA